MVGIGFVSGLQLELECQQFNQGVQATSTYGIYTKVIQQFLPTNEFEKIHNETGLVTQRNLKKFKGKHKNNNFEFKNDLPSCQ